MDSFFFAAISPGPMSLVSAFFSDNYPDSDCRSFSQLLAGAMASPGARPTLLSPDSINHDPSEDAADNSSLGFRQNRPMTLAVAHSPMFLVYTSQVLQDRCSRDWGRVFLGCGRWVFFPCFDSREEEKLNPERGRDDRKGSPQMVASNISRLSSGADRLKTRNNTGLRKELSVPKDMLDVHIAAQTFAFRELAVATKNFRPESFIGEGGFGRVYKGRLESTGQV